MKFSGRLIPILIFFDSINFCHQSLYFELSSGLCFLWPLLSSLNGQDGHPAVWQDTYGFRQG